MVKTYSSTFTGQFKALTFSGLSDVRLTNVSESDYVYWRSPPGKWSNTGNVSGVPGADGADGSDGADGKTILNGSGDPPFWTGQYGDFWINTTTNTISGPKTTGGWPSGVSLIGPEGTAGTDGSDGADFSLFTNVVNTNTTISTIGTVLLCRSGVNITLPPLAENFYCYVKNIETLDVVIAPSGSGELIDGRPTLNLSGQYDSAKLISDGTAWYIF